MSAVSASTRIRRLEDALVRVNRLNDILTLEVVELQADLTHAIENNEHNVRRALEIIKERDVLKARIGLYEQIMADPARYSSYARGAR